MLHVVFCDTFCFASQMLHVVFLVWCRCSVYLCLLYLCLFVFCIYVILYFCICFFGIFMSFRIFVLLYLCHFVFLFLCLLYFIMSFCIFMFLQVRKYCIIFLPNFFQS